MIHVLLLFGAGVCVGLFLACCAAPFVFEWFISDDDDQDEDPKHCLSRERLER